MFCGDDALVRNFLAWELLEADAAYGNMLNFDAIVRCAGPRTGHRLVLVGHGGARALGDHHDFPPLSSLALSFPA